MHVSVTGSGDLTSFHSVSRYGFKFRRNGCISREFLLEMKISNNSLRKRAKSFRKTTQHSKKLWSTPIKHPTYSLAASNTRENSQNLRHFQKNLIADRRACLSIWTPKDLSFHASIFFQMNIYWQFLDRLIPKLSSRICLNCLITARNW